jgi:hypothetical protein
MRYVFLWSLSPPLNSRRFAIITIGSERNRKWIGWMMRLCVSGETLYPTRNSEICGRSTSSVVRRLDIMRFSSDRDKERYLLQAPRDAPNTPEVLSFSSEPIEIIQMLSHPPREKNGPRPASLRESALNHNVADLNSTCNSILTEMKSRD